MLGLGILSCREVIVGFGRDIIDQFGKNATGGVVVAQDFGILF